MSVLTLTWYISEDEVQWEADVKQASRAGLSASRAQQGCHLLGTRANARAAGGGQGALARNSYRLLVLWGSRPWV